jgi:hypothetical protein
VSAVAERSATEAVCTNCGARLGSDQDWCLECGDAVTVRIRTAPDWRVPLAIVAGVVTLVAVGLVFALVALSNSADRSAAAVAPAAAPAPAPTPAPAAATRTSQAPTPATGATTPAAATTTAPPAPAIASWPTGVTGYTVVLGVIPEKAVAKASATKIRAAGIPVGLLYSSDYSSMHPGHWIVFSGTYGTRTQAEAAAVQLQGKGQTDAYAWSVVPAG